MKAVWFRRFGGPDVVEVVDLPAPRPGRNEVRITVRAAGVNASDWKKRRGLMDRGLPQTMGYEAAGVVDELGDGVADVAIGDRVFGFATDGAAQAELAVLTHYVLLPGALGFAEAAALPAAAEAAVRGLDQLGIGSGHVLLINGASGNVGRIAVQVAVGRGARVIGTASPHNHDLLRSLGAEPVAHGSAMADQVRALAPSGVDLALDVAGNGVLRELIDLAGGRQRVITLADVAGSQRYGVRFSRGDDGRALYSLELIANLVAAERLSLPPITAFPLADAAEAHRTGEAGLVRGKLVLLPD